MSKKKVSTVTVIFAIMLAAIEFGLLKLYPLGFAILTGILAGFGFCELAKLFSSWLSEKPDEPLAPVVACEQELLPDDFSVSFEDIMKEVEAEREKTS